ncbi:MAG: hypothetical protein GXW90_09250 [Tepidanaerobacter acetatoxydans]|uniref:hypothetical protein n=1 Tax=Tepidanaerobacter acetatoxydans TaxID=499229 RepID=UPI0026ED382D|nr:hypothetical protein [Tepidanaerobacter acetatoxydans]NLU11098.1 hypothetical protein [Tepidanaerobacter acetatoxydans]
MAYLKITINLLSPIILSADVPDNNLTETFDYIPASSLIGLFAAKYISQEHLEYAHNNTNFYKWFLKGDLVFTNAYISEKDDYDEIDMLPTPLCIKKQKKGERILNILLNTEDEQTVFISPYSYIERSTIKTGELAKKINFHHMRDRLRGHTKDEAMFNYEALMPGQIFKGEIYGDSTTLREFRKTFGEKIIGRLGKSRNTEYGEVEISLSKIINEDIDALTDEDLEDEDYILLTFISPCILVNENGFPDPSLPNLKCYLENILGKDSFEIENCVMRTTSIENYISVWKMKRPIETAISAGSTVKLVFKNNLPFENIKNGFKKMANDGIGERKNEGFGRIKLNMATAEEYYKKTIKPNQNKPESKVPQGAKQIFENVIQNMFKEEFERKAYEDAAGFSRLPSNSLLGKLGLILSKCQKEEEFKKSIDELRNNAKSQLEDCRNKTKRCNLYEYIKNFDTTKTIESIYNDITKADYLKLTKISEYNVKDEKELLLELWKIYFGVFFRRMRQMQKVAKKEVL